ncbi:329b63eb-b35e-4c2c-840d-10a39349830c [Sclerotinia trifoliorum]|uniref:329b63eb-b35e-4c2c-840d-10a39349830c n=1 Tax=Sclerotinia trifoliorum TaxID=28548 RepID=A0A8H2W3K1_9HELO|nr:329b63eb-b35e-4c2c-840d-10a39349830c [Sclerotinia trifoliorum]
MATSDRLPRTTLGLGLPLEAYNNFQHDSLTVPRQFSDSASIGSSENAAMKGKKRAGSQHASRPKAHSSSSHKTYSTQNTHSTSATQAQNRAAQREARSLPAWISSYEDDNDPTRSPPKRVPTPSRIHPVQHDFIPTQSTRRISLDGYVDSDDDTYNAISDKKVETGFFGGLREPVRGRKWDHARDAEPVIVRSGVQSNAAVWRNFVKASEYGASEGEEHTLVDHDFLNNLTPGYDRPWCGDLEKGEGDDDDNITSLIYNKKETGNFCKTRAANYSHESLCSPYFSTYCAYNFYHRLEHRSLSSSSFE